MALRVGTILMLSVITFGANAADWQDLMRQPVDGEMMSIDKASLVDLGNSMTEGWARHTFKTPSRITNADGTPGSFYNLQLSRYVFDCKGHRQKVMEIIVRDKSGKTVLADQIAQPTWDSVPPDTYMYARWVWGCSKHYPRR